MFVKRYGCGRDRYFCLHGWSGDHSTFDPLEPYLPTHVSVFAADLPGCGFSAEPVRWDPDSIADEIADAIGSAPVTLVGNCIGALLGMRAVLKRPEAVTRLVLIDAFARWPWYFSVFTAPGWGPCAYACAFANPVGRWITNRALAGKRTGKSDLTAGFARVHHDVALRYLDVLRQLGSAEDFAGIRLPVDIVFGERTFRAVRESAAVWRSMWPWARIRELSGAGHLPIREAAGQLSRIVFEGGQCQSESTTMSNTTVR